MNTAVKVGIGVATVALVGAGGYFVYSRLPKPAPSGAPAGAKDGYFWMSKDGSPRQAASLDALRSSVVAEYGGSAPTAIVKVPGGTWTSAAPLFATGPTSPPLPPPPVQPGGPNANYVEPLVAPPSKGPSADYIAPLGGAPKGPTGEGVSRLLTVAEQQAQLADEAALAMLRLMGTNLQMTEMKTKDGHILLMGPEGELHTADGKLYQTDKSRTVLLDGVEVYVRDGVPYLRNGIRAFTKTINLMAIQALPQKMTMTKLSHPAIASVGALRPGGSMTWRELRLRSL